MNKFSLAAGSLLITGSQLCGAVKPTVVLPAVPASSQMDVIERGGTIDSVDAKKQSVTVDGYAYLIPLGSVRIHTLSNHISGNLAELRSGMQIRFTSVKDPTSGKIQFREIWISNDRRPAKS